MRQKQFMSPSESHQLYKQKSQDDWDYFLSSTSRLPDYWSKWEESSENWRIPIQFIQPLGLEYPEQLNPIQNLMDELAELEELEVPPLNWIHMTYIHVGFLSPLDVLWSQVESFYVNAAPRIRRVEPFSIEIRNLSISPDGRVYINIFDNGSYQELRRQISLGVPFIGKKMNNTISETFIPTMDIAYTTGKGDKEKLITKLENYRSIDAGTFNLNLMKLARVPIQPHDHYLDLDVIAEIPLLGAQHRKGYHN